MPSYLARYPSRSLRNNGIIVFRWFISYSKMMEKWCIPFLGADPSVVRRSQRHSVEVRDKKPVQYGAYVAMPSLLAILLFLFFGVFFALLCQFKMGRNLLEKVTSSGHAVYIYVYSSLQVHVTENSKRSFLNRKLRHCCHVGHYG